MARPSKRELQFPARDQPVSPRSRALAQILNDPSIPREEKRLQLGRFLVRNVEDQLQAIMMKVAPLLKGMSKSMAPRINCDGDQYRRAAVVDRLALEVSFFREHDALTGSLLEHLARRDPRFAGLDPAFVEQEIRGAHSPGGARGRGNRGALLLAARFSVAVGAFGDVEEIQAKEWFRRAVKTMSRGASQKSDRRVG